MRELLAKQVVLKMMQGETLTVEEQLILDQLTEHQIESYIDESMIATKQNNVLSESQPSYINTILTEHEAWLSYKDVTLGEVKKANFDGQTLHNISFIGSNLRYASFRACYLENINFSKADCRNIDFSGSILKNIDFTKADLRDIILNKVQFIDIKLNDTKIDFKNRLKIRFNIKI